MGATRANELRRSHAACLGGYDALAVFANIDTLPPEAEAAVVEYVRGGKGLVPLY